MEEAQTNSSRPVNPRRKKPTPMQIFKERFLPLIIVALTLILIIVFIASLISITSSDKTPWKKYGVTEEEYMETIDFLNYLDDVYGE